MKHFSIIILASIMCLQLKAAEIHEDVKHARSLIAKLSKGKDYHGKNSPYIGSLTEWNIGVTSVHREIPLAELQRLYKETCLTIEKHWGKSIVGYEANTGRKSRYAVLNIEGPSLEVKQIVVGLVHGNDSSSFVFYTRRKPFAYKDTHSIRKSWSLD